MIDTSTPGLTDALAAQGIWVEMEYPAGIQRIHGDAALAESIAAAWVPPPPQVPAEITQSQMRRWLWIHKTVRDADVRAIIAALPEAEQEPALIEWEYAATIHRAHPLVSSLGAALGMDAAALDQAFREAAQL